MTLTLAWSAALVAGGLLAGSVAAGPVAAAPAGSGTAAAPGGPGQEADYTPANKTGYGTSRTTASKVWFTLQGGRMSEVYYPDISTPATRTLEFVVTDGHSFTVRDRDARVRTERVSADAPAFRQVVTDRLSRWRMVKTYVTDPARSSVLVHVHFQSLTGHPYHVYAFFDPDLTGNGNDDTARSERHSLTAHDAHTASALVSRRGFTATSSGFLGTSDGWTDLRNDHRMDWHYRRARDGNVAQLARTRLDGVRHRSATLAVGFARHEGAALHTARASVRRAFPATAAHYRNGWRRYLHSLPAPPGSVRTWRELRAYRSSQLVLASAEDKTYRGAFVASPSMPWAWAYDDQLVPTSGPYHLVWPRDEYEMATALLAEGDRAAAERALDYMFDRQQRPDGHLPQNTTADGTPYWTSIQLDETADPIILAHQLGRTDARTWRHVKAAADFIVGFSMDGHRAPWTQQERWEEQSGYSPATIAAEIAGLVCAADIARANGDDASARSYLDTADRWQRHVDDWTVTHNGPYSPKPYYLRLSKDGDPDAGTTYDLGNSSFTGVDQRSVVDPSFLELVRLGVKRANDPVIRNTVQVVDRQLSVQTPRGRFWHRYSWDGYGETRTGAPWDTIYPPNSRTTLGRLWPLLSGERGEYELLAAEPRRAAGRLADMAATMNSGGLMSEQVWGNRPPTGQDGHRSGKGTFSATPLVWTHAEYLRLAWSLQAGTPVERPAVVAERYAGPLAGQR